MAKTLEFGWSRSILLLQIEKAAHLRQGNTVNNFASRLPTQQSVLQQTLNDPYLFDFLTLGKNFHKRELETGSVRHLEKFLLELGQGFASVGRQFQVIFIKLLLPYMVLSTIITKKDL
jgi:predicted nuclease of restriction endonuclease-like (RecB) superfamily